jgi:hypothetical protein
LEALVKETDKIVCNGCEWRDEKIAALKAQNERLRKALEKAAKINPNHPDICATGEYLIMRAREALAHEDIFDRIENANKEELHHVKQGKEE